MIDLIKETRIPVKNEEFDEWMMMKRMSIVII
jgi:hypothetical protein